MFKNAVRALAVVLVCGTASAAYAQSPGQPIPPAHFFDGPLLHVYSPDSEGWLVTGRSGIGIAFGKRGTAPNETFGAQAVMFELGPEVRGDALVDFVRKRIATMNPPPRFEETTSAYRYHEARGYPCVDVNVGFHDNAAVTPSGEQRMLLRVIALYCRHPVVSDLGFFAAYSHRGPSGDAEIKEAAMRYIAGVTVNPRIAEQVKREPAR